MRALTLNDFDAGLTLSELAIPEPAADEVLIRVHASSLNGFDAAVAAGMVKGMMEHQFPVTLGRDVAGVVERVRPAVTRFRPGDEVFGMVAKPVLHDGAWAEYAIPAEGTLAPKPRKLDWVHAAALPLAGTAALMVVEAVKPSPGDLVLIVGATGGVGNYAVQLAAARGARVVATGLPRDEVHLRDLGTAETVDYSAEDIAAAVRARYPGGITGLIDLVNRGDDFAALAELVASGGRVASSLGAANVEQLASRDVAATNIFAAADTAILSRLANLADTGKLRVTVERVYRLDVDDVKEGLAVLATGRARGKLALAVVGE